MPNNPAAQIFLCDTESYRQIAVCYDGKLWQLAQQQKNIANIHLIGSVFKIKVLNRLNNKSAICDLGGISGFLEASASSAPEGAWILAQIRREAFEDKGPTLTTDLQFVSRYLVHKPGTKAIEIAAGLPLTGKAVQDLRNILLALGWAGIIKSQAAKVDTDFIVQLAKQQLENWKTLNANYHSAQNPGLILESSGFVERILADLPNVSVIFAPTPLAARNLKKCLDPVMPDLAAIIQSTASPDIFLQNDIIDQWHQALSHEWQLPGGMRIRFDENNTLTAIDIDSGGAAGDSLMINKSVVPEVARLIALKNIGGVILIDFLKMKDASQRTAILDYLQSAMMRDPLHPQILGFTKTGLCEITRARRGAKLLGPAGVGLV